MAAFRAVALVGAVFLAAGFRDAPSAGDVLALWPCADDASPYAARQAVAVHGASPPDSLASHIVLTSSGLVYDISGPSSDPGTSIHAWGPYVPVHASQTWRGPSAGGAPAAVSSLAYAGMCLEAAFAGVGAPLTLQPCAAGAALQSFAYAGGAAPAARLALAGAASPALCAQAGNNTPTCASPPFSSYAYCNVSLPAPARVADLVSRMTVAEKALVLDSSVPALPRLGVPAMPSGEALHGAATGCLSAPAANSTGCPTSFPCALAMAAAFDATLWTAVGAAIGTEARALHNLGAGSVWLFAPNVNPCRAPNWGRCQEVPGEDANVVSAYAVAYISGMQGAPGTAPPDPRYRLAAATGKHFVAYDLEGFIPRTDPQPRPAAGTCDTGGGCQRWNFDALPPARDLDGYYLPPFLAAAAANVSAFMCAYSGVNRQPACASDLIASALRGAAAWSGMIVSDCTALELMSDEKWDNCKPPFPPLSCTPDGFSGHDYSEGAVGAVNAALGAGVDVNCGPLYRMWLEGLVANGSVAETALDTAVARVYTTAISLGLLDAAVPQVYASYGAESVDSAPHRALALRAARESLVLLKNDGVLPLAPGLKIAFIGPHANATQDFLSNYHGGNTLVDSHSPLAVARARGWPVTYARGCNICDVVPPGFPNMPCPPGAAANASMIPAAAAAAAAADVAVVFVGLDQTSEAENFDRSTLSLPGVQDALVAAVLAAQRNTVVVLVHGGPIAAPAAFAGARAILDAVYGGELAGDAIVDALAGDFSPAGKLPMTYYYDNITARDIRDMDLSSAGGITHSFFSGPVLFPFGTGLSYAQFSWAWAGAAPQLTVAAADLAAWARAGGAARPPRVLAVLELAVTHVGGQTSDVVTLAFLRPAANATAARARLPVQSLVAFAREHELRLGDVRRLSLPVHAHTLAALAGCLGGGGGGGGGGDSAPRVGDYALTVGDGDGAATATLRVV